MQGLPEPTIQKDHISEVENSDNLDEEENDPTHGEEEVNCDDDQREQEEENTIANTVKAILKRNKPSLKSEGDQGIEQKDVEYDASVALAIAKTKSSAHDLQMVEQERPLKSEDGGGNKNKTYQNVFITRMTVRSVSSLVA